MRLLPAAILAVLALAAPAAAHVTTTVEPLAGPLVVGQATNVTVHFSEPCFEAVPQEAQGQDTIMAGLDPGAPSFIHWAGETVPFSMQQCDATAVPLAQVRATATLTLAPTADAPGLTPLALPVTSYLGGGTQPGENVTLDVTIAHHANGTLRALEARGHDAHAAAHHASNGTMLALVVEATTNAPSLLTFEARASTGEVQAIDAIAFDPPAYRNESTSQVEAMARFTPPAQWSEATITFAAYLTPTVGGPRVPVGNATVTLANEAAHEDGHGDGHDHTHAQEDTPGPGSAPLALAIAALAWARRR